MAMEDSKKPWEAKDIRVSLRRFESAEQGSKRESFNIRVCWLAVHGRMEFMARFIGEWRESPKCCFAKTARMFFFNVLHTSMTYSSSNNHLRHSQLGLFSISAVRFVVSGLLTYRNRQLNSTQRWTDAIINLGWSIILYTNLNMMSLKSGRFAICKGPFRVMWCHGDVTKIYIYIHKYLQSTKYTQ